MSTPERYKTVLLLYPGCDFAVIFSRQKQQRAGEPHEKTRRACFAKAPLWGAAHPKNARHGKTLSFPLLASFFQEETRMNSISIPHSQADPIVLQARGLKKYYGRGETEVRALDGVDLDIERGRFTAIIGTSGSGKSTLLNMLGGLDTPSAGSIRVGDTELARLSSEEAAIFRRKQIGFIFQNYNLVPVLSVWENIIFPIALDGRRPDREFIMQIIHLLGLEKKLDTLPGSLSGGQQQRVAIARALASKPSIILADEPTGNLDTRTSDDVMGLLKMTIREFRQTLVMITHNPQIAQMADRVIRMEDGKIVSQ